MNTAVFPLVLEGTFCRGRVMWRLAGVLCRGRFSELKTNDFTCHCRKGEGGLASYVCPRWGWQEIISSVVINRTDSPWATAFQVENDWGRAVHEIAPRG